ncbi:MAG: hypothetical protein Q7J27_14595 [Syntrophales bacterium]|nr:hypothetical protein [Syntrophales bacterium]
MIVTTKKLMSKKPCEKYTKAIVSKLLGKGKTLLEICDLDIPAKDRIWAVTKFLDDTTNRTFAIWCAKQCKADGKEVKEYIKVIERFYKGNATREELDVAYRAAYWVADRVADRAADWEKMREKQIRKLKSLVKQIAKRGLENERPI